MSLQCLASHDPLDPVGELRVFLAEHGYLLFRRLLPEDVLRELHQEFCDATATAGWALDRGTDASPPRANGASACASPNPKYLHVYHELYCSERLHRLPHQRELLALMQRLLGGEVLVHPRLVGRLMFPRQPDFLTPPHQDFFQVQGSADTLTCWIPLHDCPMTAGGLSIADGSHHAGLRAVEPAMGASGAAVSDAANLTWRGSDVYRGDVLVFTSMTVHRGIPNEGERLRFSVDARYQRLSDPVMEMSLEFGPRSDLSWEHIYEHWECDENRYYWQSYPLTIAEVDRSVLDELERMAFAMGEQGDRRAISSLQRVAAHSLIDERRTLALSLLGRLGVSGDSPG